MEMTLLELLGMVLVTVVFLGVGGLVLASLAAHTWRQFRGGPEKPATDEILDRLDQIELRLAAVSERLLPRDSGSAACGKGGDAEDAPTDDGGAGA